MYELVNEAERVLEIEEVDLDRFGELLDTTWQLKRTTGGAITTSSIDSIYERAKAAGASGGKLLGAGGGGFFVFYVREESRETVINELKDLLYVPFAFEDGGTRVIQYSPEMYIPRERIL